MSVNELNQNINLLSDKIMNTKEKILYNPELLMNYINYKIQFPLK